MYTEIDNNQRVFQITTSTGKQAFCNIEQLNEVVSTLSTHVGYFKIFHFWNNKPKTVTKKYLKECFDGSGLKQEFYY